MMGWWQERTEREKMMLICMGVIISGVLMYYAVLRPVRVHNTEAVLYLENAMALHDDVRAGADALSTLSQRGAGTIRRDDRPARVIVSAQARASGLGVTRIQPMDSGAVSFWLNNADATTLFDWIVELQTEYGIAVMQADIQKVQGGTNVQAQLVFRKIQ